MAEEEATPIPVLPETVDESDDADGAEQKDDAEAAKEAARAQAEARRKRILEKANNRMKYVNGEQTADPEEKKTRNSNAARIRAARQRRYGKKSTSASTTSTTPATTSTPETETSAAAETTTTPSAAPEAEPEKVESEKEKTVEAPIEPAASTEETTASTTAAEPTTKKKYVGVARMRRKMLVKKKMEEENNDSGASSMAGSESSKASLATNGKGKTAASSTSVGKAGLSSMTVQTVPIYMHIMVILLLFVAGFDVGIQQFHADVDVRTQVAVQEFGVPILHRNPWHPLKPVTAEKDSKETLEEKLSSSTSTSITEDLEDEFEEIDEEYVPPNIDPIFRVDLDEFTKGPGFLNQMARGAISIHRLICWIFFFGPMGMLSSILSIPAAIMKSPPGLFLAAVILRQVIGKGVGAAIPNNSADEGADGAKQNNIEVISMAKNFVKNFFATTFPTLVSFYDAYLHLKSDMYVVLCGVFFGLAWTHLRNDALSCDADADAVVDAVVDALSEGEL
eukprot:CAMPEP_0116102928 /NCGR_PEP_ID=MMETSP0327-20121206/13614_1 /TAXON_ID=44447 /ORGANISM="Pseudo-nitzschia delicatissima, Strain B596" /LENGTH=508 /DNA_ID=CAMNT_0003595007 /DNA_START=20 /DNA_END=1546 /DNA_ORIENTATION=+